MAGFFFTKSIWSRPLISWYLYDFANSFLVINTTLYFSQWVVVDRGLADFWFALPFMAATGFLVFLSPYIGEVADRRGSHYSIFFRSTIAALFAGIFIFIAGRLIGDEIFGVALALLAYGLFQFFLQLALVPYNAFIKYLADPLYYGKVSGLGFGFNQLGYIAGLFLTIPVVSGVVTFLGTDRLAPLVPATFAFLLFALPSLFLLRSIYAHPAAADEQPDERLSFWTTFWVNFKASKNYPGVRPLLVAFYFFSSAIMSLTLFSAIYLQKVFGAPDSFKIKVFLFVIAGYTIGAILGGVLSDRIGHRRILVVSLLGTAISIMPIALVQNIALTLILFPAFGLAIGVVYASSRAYLASLIPQDKSGRYFGLYTFAERSASVIGPAFWGTTVWALSGFFPWNYRAAAFVMAVLVFIGVLFLIVGRGRSTAVRLQ